jgi:hypothetical protein
MPPNLMCNNESQTVFICLIYIHQLLAMQEAMDLTESKTELDPCEKTLFFLPLTTSRTKTPKA